MPPANALLPLPPLGYGRNLDEAGGAFYLINNINRTGVTEFIAGCGMAAGACRCESIEFDRTLVDVDWSFGKNLPFENSYALTRVTSKDR